MKKFLALILAAAMVLSLAGCGGGTPSTTEAPKTTEAAPSTTQAPATTEAPETTEAPTQAPADDRLAAEVIGNTYDPADWFAESEELYEEVLGEFLEAYAKVKDAKSLSERYALQAIAEATMYGSALFIPLTTKGGNYRFGRVVPKSVNTTLWGSNEYRYHTVVVTTEIIKADDYNYLKAMWSELAGTGTYIEKAKAYLTEKGYQFKDSYELGYSDDPDTWDFLASSRAAVGEPLGVTIDGLYVYDEENRQVPAIAKSHDVSEDGLTYTFHLRDDVVWVDSQGRKIADLKADDFVAGLQHLMDSQSSPRGLLIDVLKGAKEYINGDDTDFANVGIKAVDDYTLEYTLEKECPYFLSMLAYNIFLPMNRAYFESEGGELGNPDYATAEGYTYGSSPEHIAYCGPMVITNWTQKNTIVYKANESYYDPDKLNVHSITWKFNDGSDTLKAYRDTLDGTIDAAGLNTDAVETCKAEGNFEPYVTLSETDATTYCGWLNINRKIYTNYNSEAVASPKTMDQANAAVTAMQNVHFRRALIAGFDHANYNAQSVGEELKNNALRNSYTPATFVSLSEDVTVDIDGKATEFKAGTFYGQIIQAVLDARDIKITVWNNELGAGDGYDGWYNPEYCQEELKIAAEELAKEGISISKENPIQIDYPYVAWTATGPNRANAVKQSIEEAAQGLIQINLVPCNNTDEYYDNSYYTTYGYEQNTDLNTSSGWGPDYGDPQTYLATMVIDEDGYMLANLGMFGQ